jgi:histidinol dehydrogenase
MRIVKLNETSRRNILADLLKRDPNNYGTYADTVQEIVETVKRDGDQAVFAYTKEFDKAEIKAGNLKVTEQEIEEAMKEVDPELIEILKKSMKNIHQFHEKQRQYSWFDSKPDGTILGQKITPLESVGVYVPGG